MLVTCRVAIPSCWGLIIVNFILFAKICYVIVFLSAKYYIFVRVNFKNDIHLNISFRIGYVGSVHLDQTATLQLFMSAVLSAYAM